MHKSLKRSCNRLEMRFDNLGLKVSTYRQDPSSTSTAKPGLACWQRHCTWEMRTYRRKNVFETVALGEELHRELGREEAEELDCGALQAVNNARAYSWLQ
jgi:hypothetical protein